MLIGRRRRCITSFFQKQTLRTYDYMYRTASDDRLFNSPHWEKAVGWLCKDILAIEPNYVKG